MRSRARVFSSPCPAAFSRSTAVPDASSRYVKSAGLSVPHSAVTFTRTGPGGEAQDVTAEAMALLAQLARSPVKECLAALRCALLSD